MGQGNRIYPILQYTYFGMGPLHRPIPRMNGLSLTKWDAIPSSGKGYYQGFFQSITHVPHSRFKLQVNRGRWPLVPRKKKPKKVGTKAMKKNHFSCWQNKQSPTNNKIWLVAFHSLDRYHCIHMEIMSIVLGWESTYLFYLLLCNAAI